MSNDRRHPVFADGAPWPELMLPEEAARAIRLDYVGGGKQRDMDLALQALERLVERGVLQVTRIGKERRYSVSAVLACIDRLTDPPAAVSDLLAKAG